MILSAIPCVMQGTTGSSAFTPCASKAEVATQPERLGKEPNDVSIYARTNLWIINTARVEAADPGKIYALLVWDEKPRGDGPGGTSDFQQKSVISAARSKSSIPRTYHEPIIRIPGTAARAAGKVARGKSEME